MDDVALSKALRVMTSEDMKNLTRNTDTWGPGHGSACKINDDTQALNVGWHDGNGDFQMKDDMTDLSRGCSGILEARLHVKQRAALCVETRDVHLSCRRLKRDSRIGCGSECVREASLLLAWHGPTTVLGFISLSPLEDNIPFLSMAEAKKTTQQFCFLIPTANRFSLNDRNDRNEWGLTSVQRLSLSGTSGLNCSRQVMVS